MKMELCHYQLEIDDLRMLFVLYSNEPVEERISCFQFSSIPYGVEMFHWMETYSCFQEILTTASRLLLPVKMAYEYKYNCYKI